MQRDRDLVAAGVGDGVVFVRRDQAAGAAGTGMHAAGGAEAETLAVAFEQLVLGDFQFAVPAAPQAPTAAVFVDRRPLSGRPSHRPHADAVLGAALPHSPPRLVFKGFKEHSGPPPLPEPE